MKKIDKRYTTKENELKENNPQYIILHSTANYNSFNFLFDLHVNKNKWSGVGYHIFISDGHIYYIRNFDKEGAHAIGFNFNSVGLCISNQKVLSQTDLNFAKEPIEEIRSQYGNLPVISHTLAQIKYINNLSKAAGLDIHISEDQNVVLKDKFQNLKGEFNNLAGKLSTDKSLNLKSAIKSFKNCPGESFYDFILEVNNLG